MTGLVPVIHEPRHKLCRFSVDGRHEAGHDDRGETALHYLTASEHPIENRAGMRPVDVRMAEGSVSVWSAAVGSLVASGRSTAAHSASRAEMEASPRPFH